ncbi:MAG: hypothetical protein KAU46_04105 [Candidatus Aminicenantes bacterium]|nr:hypothetical protein [Candidatus Aminicenantes bacterium]
MKNQRRFASTLFVRSLGYWSQTMRFRWRELYELRGSHTVLIEAGMRVPGLLAFGKR